MRCASALSTQRASAQAFQDVMARVSEGLQAQRAELAIVFASSHHSGTLPQLATELLDGGIASHVLGCTGETIVGEDREIEDGPALSLWAIQLPRVSMRPVRLGFEEGGITGWPDELQGAAAARGTLLVVGDPFTFPMDQWLKEGNESRAGMRVVGGMASAGHTPGTNRLVLDAESFDSGAVGVFLEGPVAIRTVVSQGCRPVGRPMIVTKIEANLIREMGRRNALETLREQFASFDPEDQERASQGLHIGRVINEYKESFGRGDFLVRNVLGADDAGGLAITDTVRVGQTVQFHVRDAETADQDLRELLEANRPAQSAAGALLFSCNGRGTRLFPQPNHDINVIQECLGSIPVAGFFAMGEIGPIGGQNFLHGYTASVVLFSDESSEHG